MNRRGMKLTLVALALMLAAVAVGAPLRAQEGQAIDIPYQKFVLKNGLTLIVHEDHKAPIVAVNVWYHVGSKNEKVGKTGFAHLFEHLMFNGSENYNDDYFKVVQRVGATDLNGTTNNDRTNYFQNVPTSAVDTILWMESDRMGHLLGAISQARLDEQRGVVQNEKRQGENQPYGRAFNYIFENTYPAGHPYSWSVIGSMEDLNAASLDDVKQWFKDYYGAANAVIVIAGDIDTETAKQKVEQYFGSIDAGPPVVKQKAWVAKRHGTHRQIMQDRVPQARIYKVWNTPEWGSLADTHLDLISDILTNGKVSRLYKRLVYDDQVATNVFSFQFSREIGSHFIIVADARPGVELAKVEKAIDEELGRFLKDGPTAGELNRAKTQYRAQFLRGIERIGGFGGKSDVLAINQVYGGSPDFYKTTLKEVAEATADGLRATANEWLSDGVYELEVQPFPKYEVAKTDVDRSKVPEAGTPPVAKFPAMQRATLANGLKVILVERASIPQVNFNLIVDSGYASDQLAAPGTASFSMDMLDEGTKTRSALQISEELQQLGANLNVGSDLDAASVQLSALKENLDRSLELYADVILNPSFPADELERQRVRRLAQIKQEKNNPNAMGLRVLPKLLYGAGHAYANPFTGSGTEESVSKMTRDDLVKFHQTWFKPNNATLIVVGDTKMAEIQPKLEKLFATWRPGEVPKKNISAVADQKQPRVYILDRPGAVQSVIFAGVLAPPRNSPNDIPIVTMNRILGGDFTSRINMNLREDKHWSYGSRTLLPDARGQRPYFVLAPVQTDKTKESVVEIQKELNGILGAIPVTADELDKAKSTLTLTLPGQWETMNAVSGTIYQMVTFGLDDNYYNTFPERVRAMTLDDVNKAAQSLIHPGSLTWVIVGDRAKIEEGIRSLNLGALQALDADGNPVAERAGAQ